MTPGAAAACTRRHGDFKDPALAEDRGQVHGVFHTGAVIQKSAGQRVSTAGSATGVRLASAFEVA